MNIFRKLFHHFFPPRTIINKIKKPKIAILVGHDFKRKGAYSEWLKASEYDYNSDLAKHICSVLIKKDYNCKVFYRDNIGLTGAYQEIKKFKPKATVELHFNAGGGHGFEIWHSGLSNDETLSRCILRAFEINVELKNRGLKTATKESRAAHSSFALPDVPNCLVESFFGDSKTDCDYIRDNNQHVVDAISDGLIEFVKLNGFKLLNNT